MPITTSSGYYFNYTPYAYQFAGTSSGSYATRQSYTADYGTNNGFSLMGSWPHLSFIDKSRRRDDDIDIDEGEWADFMQSDFE